jgi:gamma-glutamyltranspeptidase/glutathione hydrolase
VARKWRCENGLGLLILRAVESSRASALTTTGLVRTLNQSACALGATIICIIGRKTINFLGMPTLYPLIMGREAVIATEHYLSAAAGARIFSARGNAIDAAIAATLVEGVVNPHMHTIGGEAPMLIYSADRRQVVAINGNMMAPARATIECYQSRGFKLMPYEGLLAAGVPAALDALVTVLATFGTLTFSQVAEPAMALCEDGFPMHIGLGGDPNSDFATPGGAGASIASNAKKFIDKWPSSAAVYMPNGRVPHPGEIVKNPMLAKVYQRLVEAESTARKRGRAAGLDAVRHRFYRGDIAQEIVDWSDRNGGLLARDDLAGFTTQIEQPVAVGYRGITVHKCGPWSQGPVFLQQLRLLEGCELAAAGHNTAAYIHFCLEASKLAFADREAYYADPEFVAVPMAALLSDEYTAKRRGLIDPERASMENRPGDPIAMRAVADNEVPATGWGGGTIHVTAADRKGNLIAVTASGGWIPSSPVIPALGFPLGSRMQTFYLDQRHPNAVAPRKRPRTTLSPSLATRDGEPYLAFGTPGGDQQDQWTLQFFLNVADFGMNLQEAVEAPKFSTAHFASTFYPHKAYRGLVRIEERIPQSVRGELAARGHKIEVRPAYSEGHVLAVGCDRESGSLQAAADPRGQLASVMPAMALGW